MQLIARFFVATAGFGRRYFQCCWWWICPEGRIGDL